MEEKNQVYRIEVFSKGEDTRAKVLLKKIQSIGHNIQHLVLADVYTLYGNFTDNELKNIANLFTNPVTQTYNLNSKINFPFDQVIEIGFLPGVTDNISKTAKESIEDLLKKTIPDNSVFSSQLIFLNTKEESNAKAIGKAIANELIQRIDTKTYNQYQADNGMDYKIPIVKLKSEIQVDTVNLDIDDNELKILGKKGIPNADGTRRGPLALDLSSVKTIQEYFRKQKRQPTDIEIESIAQTWSEHCKHTIFASSLDEIKEGIYKTYIRSATKKIRHDLGDKDFCVSVFKDNSGAMIFDKDNLVTVKVETHNTPSTLDPFGGAITGIVGVNRDTIGFGMGALPIINMYGYCFGNPFKNQPLYRQKNKQSPAMSPKRIMDGVIDGVKVGGNCSGIPTPQGFVYFDDDYRGKPLVFVGTFGIIPNTVNNQRSDEKKAQPGDLIVVMGGRVGRDGIHGATFSSEAMDSGSPATAVQIGDPITQKKMSDALIKEARDRGLYTSITDNGAGGLSCSVAEMAEESGGFVVDLTTIPVKYTGIKPWEVWISESQERMTLSVPKDKIDELMTLMNARGVETTVIGEFNDTNKAIVTYNKQIILDIDMDFLHDGLPKKEQTSETIENNHTEPEFDMPTDLNATLKTMIGSINQCSFSFITNQYDFEVQGGSILKPLQGIGQVNSDASVTRPINSSNKGVVISQGITAKYSPIDTYHMAACAIDTAIRNTVAVGGNIEHMALMDNFCWCSSDDPKRLYQLKKAAKACYDYALAYKVPFISGKDSMFNDFKGYDEFDNPVQISVPPTLLVTATGVIDNIKKVVSLDVKCEGDLIYVIGITKKELGASEYYEQMGKNLNKDKKEFIGQSVPKVDPIKAKEVYLKLYNAINQELIASSISVTSGGLGIAIAKMCVAGNLGCNINLNNIKTDESINKNRFDHILFSETQSRIIVTINPKNKEAFETIMAISEHDIREVGKVTADKKLTIISSDNLTATEIINCPLDELETSYKNTFKDF